MPIYLKIITLLFSILVPGGSLALGGRMLAAFSIPMIGIAWVLFISLNRWVVSVNGFLALLIGLLCLHLLSYLVGVIITIKNSKQRKFSNSLWLFTFLVLINLATTLSCHFYKDRWFGFAFYHIPSASMAPTLLKGDVVLVDTWLYQENEVNIKDVVIIKRTENSLVLAKRVTNTHKIDDKNSEIYLEGDNKLHSVDSRRFGWISDDYLIGKVQSVWFSFSTPSRYLIMVY